MMPRVPTPSSIVGVPVHPFRLDELLLWMMSVIEARQRATILYANAYAVNLAQVHLDFREALVAADVVFCDGYGVRLASQFLGIPLPERFTPPDWIDQLADCCEERRYRLFLLGAEPGRAEQAAERLRRDFPALVIETHHGYFELGGAGERAVLDRIRSFAPHLLLVGMGMPRQELWVQETLGGHDVPIVMTVGALFDYLAGEASRGPRWLTDAGGEWLWRLLFEPRRLWRRYLLGNPAFALLVLRQRLHQHRMRDTA